MVIEVSYQSPRDSKDPHTHFKSTRYFEVDQIPARDAVARRLKNIGVDFDENTISINPSDNDAEVMRKGGISVTKF